jgi:tight adherence protein C
MDAVLPFLIPILFGASAFLFALSLVPNKSILTQQIETLEQRDPNVSEATRLAMFEKMFSPAGRASLTKKLIEAGWYTVRPSQMALRSAAGVLFGLVTDGLLWWLAPHFSATIELAMFIAVPVLFGYAPFFVLNQAIEKRKIEVQKALPDFLDMVATTVQAGLSVNAALSYAIDAAPGPLGDEMKEVLSQIRLGRARADALKSMAERVNQVELRTAITAITQAERLGANLAQVLGELSEDTRNHRASVVEEDAAKLPVKMVLPMAFCMLPTLFVLIFGALAANYFANQR